MDHCTTSILSFLCCLLLVLECLHAHRPHTVASFLFLPAELLADNIKDDETRTHILRTYFYIYTNVARLLELANTRAISNSTYVRS